MLTTETHFLFYFKTDKSDEESKCGHSDSDSESLRDSQYAWVVTQKETSPIKKMTACIPSPRSYYCPQRSWGKVIFSEACVKNSVRGGWYPSMPCRSHDQPAVYKQLHCWWVSVGEEAAYR